jgi:tetratricopeptide (TPR) repeat protein
MAKTRRAQHLEQKPQPLPASGPPFLASSQIVSILLIVGATLLAYFPAWNGKAIWDDDAHLTRPELRSLSGLGRIWFEPGATQQYYPLVHTVFWFEHHLFGDATLPCHLVNISLHILGAFLLWRILLELKVPGAALAAALFALHPVQVESVAWISELKNTLSGVFFFGALLFYLRFHESGRRLPYFLALLLFVLGLLCKTVIAPLPAVLLVIFWWQHGKLSPRRDLLPLIPFFVLGIGAGLFTAWVEHRFIGAQGQTFNLGWIERCLIAGRAFWFYLFKLFWPADLIFIYPRWNVSRFLVWQYLFPLAACLLPGALFALRKRWRGPLAAMLIFAGLLFPALGFINVYPFIFSFVADHFQYLASSAPIALSAAGASLLLMRFRQSYQWLATAFASLLLVLLTCLSWRQAHLYSDPVTLYSSTLARNPSAWMAHNNIAALLIDDNRLDEAAEHAQAALAIRPNYPEAYVNLGNISLKRERLDEAVAFYERALEIEPRLPKIHSNFGNALRLKGDFRRAIQEYEKAIALDPRSISAHNNLAWILAACPDAKFRDGTKAVALASRADNLAQGDNAIVLHTLAAAHAQAGDFPAAVATAQRALSLATAHGDTVLEGASRREIELYRSGSIYRE